MRVAIFAAHASAVYTAASAAVAATGSRAVGRNPKYFTPATLADRYDAVIVDASIDVAGAIVTGFASRGVPSFAMTASDPIPAELLAILTPPAFAGLMQAAQDAPAAASGGENPRGASSETEAAPEHASGAETPARALSELSLPELRARARALGLPATGARKDLEAAIEASIEASTAPNDGPPTATE